jgi:hypothetical protein
MKTLWLLLTPCFLALSCKHGSSNKVSSASNSSEDRICSPDKPEICVGDYVREIGKADAPCYEVSSVEPGGINFINFVGADGSPSEQGMNAKLVEKCPKENNACSERCSPDKPNICVGDWVREVDSPTPVQVVGTCKGSISYASKAGNRIELNVARVSKCASSDPKSCGK